MKRFLPLLVSFVIAAATLSAQDVIVLRTGDEVQAKVLEVGDSTIKYKKYSNPDGPTYVASKGEVFMIKYANGEKDVFGDTKPAPTTFPASAPTTIPAPTTATAPLPTTAPASTSTTWLATATAPPPTAAESSVSELNSVINSLSTSSQSGAATGTEAGTTAPAPTRAVAPPVASNTYEELLSVNPWAGKFKLGVRASGGTGAMFLLVPDNNDAGVLDDVGVGYYLGGTVYVEYNTKARNGFLLGLSGGFLHSAYYFSDGEGGSVDHTHGAIDFDLYLGGASNVRHNAFTGEWSFRGSTVVARYGARLRMPIYATSGGEGMSSVVSGVMNPLQAGIFVNSAWHYGGFGVGFDFDFMFTNAYRKNILDGTDLTSMTFSVGMFLEYSF